MREILKDNNISNYFIDTTYKVLPKNRRAYKLLTISAFNKSLNITNIACLIFYIHEDQKSLYYIFKYLHEFLFFNPKIINIDFSIAERKALLENNLFDSKPIIISCFFHFAQCLYKKMKEVKLIKSNR